MRSLLAAVAVAMVMPASGFSPPMVLRRDMQRHSGLAKGASCVGGGSSRSRSARAPPLGRCGPMMQVGGEAELVDRENAHGVGLLQEPFGKVKGQPGAFPSLPEHGKHTGAPAILDPWGKSGFPAGCPDDPFGIVAEEISPFADSIKEVLATDHPVLEEAAKHFFAQRQGKQFRPTIVMLMAKACAPEPGTHLNGDAYAKQAMLGQITEMIHVASLIHDDVLDEADTRRGGESVHKLYSNKVAVIAGDYLLARASVVLAQLHDNEVTEIMSTALESLVQGEIMQIRTAEDDLLDMVTYLRKSYHKTASLICDACKSCAILGGHAHDSKVARAAEAYGFHLGLAYQIIDDVLDFTVASDVLGKPAMADVSLGLSTAPVLYAAQSNPELVPLIKRKFKNPGDIDKALRVVLDSDGVEKAKALALFHAEEAARAASELPESEASRGLTSLLHIVLSRNS
mmetsp:Transcript_12001/g.23712  ORF Transcript_12001/g.23712 Transcript_12001/m.23712 type:complete len:456 (+) Transcript_12001:51-1418(+)